MCLKLTFSITISITKRRRWDTDYTNSTLLICHVSLMVGQLMFFFQGIKLMTIHERKRIKGKRVIWNLIPEVGTLPFQLGLWISANSVGNINTAKSLQKRRKKLLADQKSLLHWGHLVVWVIHLHLYIYLHLFTFTMVI